MVGKSKPEALLHCSFCGKDQHQVRALVAGPKVFICDGNPGFHTSGGTFWNNWGKETSYTNVGYVDGHVKMVTYTSLRDYLEKVWTSRTAR